MMRTILILLFFITANNIYAQTYTANGNGTISVDAIMSIALTTNSSSTTFSDADDYANGIVTANSVSIAVKSNVLWTINISTQGSVFTPLSTGASSNVPASILGVRVNGTSNFLTMSMTSQTLKNGSRGDPSTSGNTFSVDRRLSPGYSYNGGLYSIALLFTLTQQ